MADATYNNQNVYRKQEGDELVVADGGQVTVEDGGEIELESGGKVSGESGGILEMLSGFLFYFLSSSYQLTAEQLKSGLYNQQQKQLIGQGATSTVFSVINYPGHIGTVVFSMTSTCIAGSFAMTSDPTVGEEVLLKMHQGSTASGVVTILFSGCSYVGIKGSTLNSVTLYNSAASTGYIKLKCFTAGEWTVVDFSSLSSVVE